MTGLVATAWTSAGDTSPIRMPATSPVPIAERVAAVADAGFVGLGLVADDLAAIRASIGFAELRDLIADAGLIHVEIELLERWWIPRGAEATARDLAARESECCSFFTFEFEAAGDDVVMHVGVPPQQVEVLDAIEARVAS